MGGNFGLKRTLSEPFLAPILMDVRLILFLAVLSAVHLSLTAVGIPFWQCPIKSSLGIACPGCGLSTGIIFLLRGEWRSAVGAHAFAPVFLSGLALVFILCLLPRPLHHKTVHGIAAVERKTGFAGLILLSLLIYGMIRILFELES